MTLRASAEQEGFQVDISGIIDPAVDIGVPGGQQLVTVGRAAAQAVPTADAARSATAVVGEKAAVTAVEIAAVFEMINRAMEATGQPVVRSRVEAAMPALRKLNAHEFPHAAQLMPPKGAAERIVGSVRRRLKRR